ncbi:MAG: hypothetical protein MI757_17135 [Pirellulales bacterium]|nr:hypothetical protein [Pirellulales bacterium]
MIAFAAMFVSGCGTGQYDQTYRKRVEELWRLEPFLALHEDPNEIPLSDKQDDAVTAQLRLPKIFDNNAKRYDPGDVGDEPVDPERMLPPFASEKDLPDFRYSYERFIGKPGQQQLPIYLYLSATQRRGSPFQQRVSSALRKAYKYKSSDLSDQWENIECVSPDKSKIEWRRLRIPIEGQSFATKMREEETKEELDGLLEVYTHSDGDRHVMFMLRMPKKLESEIDLSQVAEAVGGTLQWSEEGED